LPALGFAKQRPGLAKRGWSERGNEAKRNDLANGTPTEGSIYNPVEPVEFIIFRKKHPGFYSKTAQNAQKTHVFTLFF